MSWGSGERGRPLPLLPRFLFETDRLKVRYVLRLWLLAILPSLALSGLVGLLAPQAQPPQLATEGSVALVLIVVVAPLFETLIMGALLLGLDWLLGPRLAVVASALLWAIAHSLSAPIWGLVVWWPFLLLSIAVLTWRKTGLLTAIAIVTLAHALQNGAGMLLLQLSKLLADHGLMP